MTSNEVTCSTEFYISIYPHFLFKSVPPPLFFFSEEFEKAYLCLSLLLLTWLLLLGQFWKICCQDGSQPESANRHIQPVSENRGKGAAPWAGQFSFYPPPRARSGPVSQGGAVWPTPGQAADQGYDLLRAKHFLVWEKMFLLVEYLGGYTTGTNPLLAYKLPKSRTVSFLFAVEPPVPSQATKD